MQDVGCRMWDVGWPGMQCWPMWLREVGSWAPATHCHVQCNLEECLQFLASAGDSTKERFVNRSYAGFG